MKFYPFVICCFCFFLSPFSVFAQVIAYEQAREDSFLYQAHYHKNWYRYEQALAYAQKAIAVYEPQRSPLLAEAYYFAGVFAQNLGRGQESETYYKKTIALQSPQEPSQKWKNYYALRAQHELYKKYQQKDSLDVLDKQIIALLNQSTGVAYEAELDIFICNYLYVYYFNIGQYDLAQTFIMEGDKRAQKVKNINSPLLWEFQFKNLQWQFLFQRQSPNGKKKIQELLNRSLTTKPLLPMQTIAGYKTQFIADMYVKDSAGLFSGFARYKNFVQTHLGEQHIQMGYYYLDYAVMLKDGYMRRPEALVEIEKGMKLLEKSQDPIDKRNHILSCYNAGSMATEISQTPADYLRAQPFFYKGLQMSIAADGEKINPNNLPNFGDSKTRCDDVMMTYRLLQALYYNYYYLYEQNHNLSNKDILLNFLEKITQLYERKTAALQNGANFDQVADEYQTLQSDYIRLYMFLYKKDKSAKILDAIIQHAENSKSIATRRHLNQDKAFALAGVPAPIVAAYKQEKDLLKSLEIQYAVLLKESRKAEAEQVQKIIVDKKLNLQKTETELQQNYPQYAQLMYNPPVKGLVDIQKNMDKRSAFLYCLGYYKLERQLIICKDTAWLSDNEYDWYAQTEMIDVTENMVQSANWSILSEQQQLDSFASHYRFLTKKIFPDEASLNSRNISQLIISPAKISNIVPFELLLLSDKKPADTYKSLDYLLKKYAVQYVNSATLWLENKQQSARNSHNGKVLAYAPTYQQGVKNKNRSDIIKNMRANLSELSGTVREIDNLKQYYYGDFRTGVAANEQQFRQDLQQPYAILHLAMHGLWDSDNPDLSALVLSESEDTTADNFLNAYELAQLQSSSQLVVLSACETGKGEQQSTDGVMSIARYLMYGGAPAVIATRWQVNDQATAFIMQNFYKYIYEGKKVKEAIRTAQLDYLSQAKGMAAHPHYWAAFINIGNTDESVYLAHKDWAVLYYIIGALSVSALVGLGWWKWRKGKE